MGGLPSDGDARKCIQALRSEFGWEYHETKGARAHPAGYLHCKEHSRDGCRINVAGTGKNTAKKIWAAARRCSHKCAPNRAHW